jgi:hypothetical protein
MFTVTTEPIRSVRSKMRLITIVLFSITMVSAMELLGNGDDGKGNRNGKGRDDEKEKTKFKSMTFADVAKVSEERRLRRLEYEEKFPNFV